MSSLWHSTRASLDDFLALLDESLGKLKAARSIDVAEVVTQIESASESARNLRALIATELPEASWQTQEELDGLLKQIEQIVEAKAVEQRRSRILALAAQLERGTIVHRRALRANKLTQLRDQAIKQLRTQAALEGVPPTLPGPEADEWIDWACALREPEGAESLQALRDGFAHLDEFVANVEPSMWVAAGSPASEMLPEPESSAEKTQPEPSQRPTNGFEEPAVLSGVAPIELKAAESSGGRDEPRFPKLRDELSPQALDSNAPAPNHVTPPLSKEEIERIHARERELLAGMMGRHDRAL